MSYLYRFVIVITGILVLAGCTGGVGPSAPQEPNEPFDISVDGRTEETGLLKMKRDSLGERFLLQGSMAEQRGYGMHISNPTSSGMKSRVVTFQEDGDRLLMLEVADGYQPGGEIPAHALITTFPIKKKDGDEISFDFNEGMSHVVISWDWYVSDYYGNVIWRDHALEIDNSYLRKVETEDGAITIVQTMTVRNWSYLIPIEATYYLTRYKENPAYRPVESPGFDYLGFFEANPLVQEGFGVPYTYISLWDISKPIIYYVSRDVPAEYRETVKEGILYWNRAFGSDIIEVKLAPEGMTAPDFNHNIIQWHTDHNTGAYADAQLDPLTGEILHSQIFISTGLTEDMRGYYFDVIDRELDEAGLATNKKDNAEEQGGKTDGPKFEGSSLCHLTLSEIFKGLANNRDIFEALPEDRIKSLTLDMLRWVVAHEVGHTMGLRHNFAASAINDLGGDEEKKIFRNYLREGKLPDDTGFLMNSVMEYPAIDDIILTGAMNGREGVPPLPYDKYAIRWAYFGSDQYPGHEGHPFCTDSQVWSYDDCNRWDSGRHLVERRVFEAIYRFNRIPRFLSEAYLAAKANFNPKRRRPVKEATPSARALAAVVGESWQSLVKLFRINVNLVSIRRQFPDYTDVDRENLDEETLKWLNYEIANAGGIEEIARLIGPEFFEGTVQKFGDEFRKIVTEESFKNVRLPEGGSTEFTAEEIAYIINRSGELFPEVVDQIAAAVTSALKPFRYDLGVVSDQETSNNLQLPNYSRQGFQLFDSIEAFEPLIARWAEYVIMNTLPRTAPIEEIPCFHFKYSIETRRAAAGLLLAGGPLPEWLVQYVPPIVQKLKGELETAFGKPIEEVNIQDYPRAEREDIRKELDIYYMLAMQGGIPVPMPKLPKPVTEENPSAEVVEGGAAGAVGWIEKLLF